MLDACNAHYFRSLRLTVPGRAARPEGRVAYTTPSWKLFGSLVRETITCTACDNTIIDHTFKSTHTIVLARHELPGGAGIIENQLMNQLCHERLQYYCDRDPGAPELGGCGNAEHSAQ